MYRPLAICIALLLVGGCLLAGGCATSDESAGDQVGSPDNDTLSDVDVPEDSIISSTGTVQYINLEGGFYGIVDRDTGVQYNPDSLAEEFRVDGLDVRFRAVRKQNVMTAQMWGQPIELLAIERL